MSAADWVARGGSDQKTRDDERLLQAWLDKDTENAAEFDAHASIFNDVGALANDEDARAILMGSTLQTGPSVGPSRRLILGGVMTIAASAAIATVVAPRVLDRLKTFATKPGQRRQLDLPDGSTVVLNTDSRLRVKYEAGERRLFLDRGQAFFRVAKASDRPFRVFVGEDEVRAIGTAFDVRRDGDVANVTLEEGKVGIFRKASTAPISDTLAKLAAPERPVVAALVPEVVLQPGEEARLAPAQNLEVAGVDIARAQAWRSGRVIMDSTPLGEAVRDFNRYGGPQIVLLDPSLEQIRVSGVFHTNRPEAFAESVMASFSVEARTTADGRIVLAAR